MIAQNPCRCVVALCYILSLCANLVAKPVNHARHLAIADGSLVRVVDTTHGSMTFKPHTLAKRYFDARNATDLTRTGAWTVQAGDTGNGIAIRLSITFIQLAFLNPTVQWRNLQIGQVLSIPCNDGSIPDSVTKSTTYTVAAGDTGNAISTMYGITFDQLSAVNLAVDWYNLQIGQILLIPNSEMDTTRMASMQDDPSLQHDASLPATIAVSPTLTFDHSMYHSSQTPTTTSDIGKEIPTDAANESSPVPDVSDGTDKSPFLTPPSGKLVKPRLARGEQQDQIVTLMQPSRRVVASSNTYGVKAGDTGYSIAAANSVSFDDLSRANPGITWTLLQIGQVLYLPKRAKPVSPTTSALSYPAIPISTTKQGQDIYTLYVGPASMPSYPARSTWLNFTALWSANLDNIGANCRFASGFVTANTKVETAMLRASILTVAKDTNVNPSFILAIMLQESSGCVRVPTTTSWEGFKNRGVMQSFNGNATCNNNGRVVSPCPAATIKSMIMEGVEGVRNVGIIPALEVAGKAAGLKWSVQTSRREKDGQLVSKPVSGLIDEAMLYYQAARIYNSGSLPADGDLSGTTGSTRCYVSDIVNRLMGWVNAPEQCSL